MKRLLFIIFILCICLSSLNIHAQTSSLEQFNVSVVRTESCIDGCWRLVKAAVEYNDNRVLVSLYDGSQGAPSYGWTLQEDGKPQYISSFPPFRNPSLTKCYNPAKEKGPYFLYAGSDITKSDVLAGFGLPNCSDVTIHATFEWLPGFKILLPVVK